MLRIDQMLVLNMKAKRRTRVVTKVDVPVDILTVAVAITNGAPTVVIDIGAVVCAVLGVTAGVQDVLAGHDEVVRNVG